jgi:hypothetical protein
VSHCILNNTISRVSLILEAISHFPIVFSYWEWVEGKGGKRERWKREVKRYTLNLKSNSVRGNGNRTAELMWIAFGKEEIPDFVIAGRTG